MYNKVYATCNGCGGTCSMQIPQVVLGFGEFVLSNREVLKGLTAQEKHEIKQHVEESAFRCRKCGPFKVDIEISNNDKTVKVRM